MIIRRILPVLLALAFTNFTIVDGLAEEAKSSQIVLNITPNSFLEPGRIRYDTHSPNVGVPADSGEALRQMPGVSGVRMGGHGVDPVIRGQDQTRLNIVLDDAFVQSGCPNRMDPPTAYAPIASYEDIEVIRGGHTVRHGEGATGGIVQFRREHGPLAPGKLFKAKAESAYVTNGDRQSYAVDAGGSFGKAFLRSGFAREDSDSYKDGNGNKVRSAFETTAVSASLGVAPSDSLSMELGWELNDADDVEFAGAKMDSPGTENSLVRGRVSWKASSGLFRALRLRAYKSDIDHYMDNFSLRSVTEGQPLLSADSDTVTTGGKLEAVFQSGDWGGVLGVDARSIAQSASRRVKSAVEAESRLQSVLWPDAETNKWGIFSQYEVSLSEMLKVEAGARFDSIYTKINELDRQPAGTFLSPNELYQTYFGTSDSVQNETNISGFAKIVSKVSMGRAGNVDFYVLGSSISRTANVTERFIASNGSNPEMRWVGNPKLDPEQHYQVEVGVISKTSKRKFTVSAYYDWVEDYILRDRARSQDGILPDDRASIYRNVEARLIGGEVDFIGSFAKNWRSRVTLSYVWANNESENEPIAQTPPLEGLVSLEYLADKWRLGGQFRAAATQTRADDDPNTGSAQDARETPGYGAVDLYGEYEFVKDVKLQLGVQNLFDQNYSNHLNKPNLFDPDSVQINEPGLSAWIKLAARI